MHVYPRVLAVVAAALFAALPAQAAMMQAVYTGTMQDGQDDGGLFFGLTDLTGQAFTATFVYDTTQGTRSTSANSDSVFGGLNFGVAAMPMLSAQLTINGRSYSFVPVDSGAASVDIINPTDTLTEHNGSTVSTVGTTLVENNVLIASQASGVIVPNLDQPLALLDNYTFNQGGFVFARTDTVSNTRTAYAGGRFYTDSVAITPVPLPAAAWLLLSGLGGLGFMAQRRKAA